MYIPALPQLAQDLGVDAGTTQLSLTAFLVAFAVGQFLIGPVSDAVGRRRILLVGTAAFALASVACALAPNATALIVARLVQGVAGACGSIAARAMLGLGELAVARGDTAAGSRLFEEALAIHRRLGLGYYAGQAERLLAASSADVQRSA